MDRIKYCVVFGILFLISPDTFACGAIDGKGFHCMLREIENTGSVGDKITLEKVLYFQDREVHEAYFDEHKIPLKVRSQNLGPYSVSSRTIEWPGGFVLNRETLELTEDIAEPRHFDCKLMVSAIAEIVRYFEPRIDAVRSTK